MAKQMKFDAEARNVLKRGFDQLADAVRVTLGPRGRAVILDRAGAAPTVSNDGITVAKEIELADPFENMGALLGREVAMKTQDVCGDGTTTAVVLAQAMIARGHRAVTSGANPMAVRRGMDRAADAIVAHLAVSARRLTAAEEVAGVAAVAVRDGTLGRLLAEALARVGPEGVVTIEEGRTLESTLDVVRGLRFDRGYLSPYFVTDPAGMEAILARPLVLLVDGKIQAVADAVPALEIAARARRPLLLIAEDVEGDALSALVVNRLRGVLEVAAVRAPGHGERRREMLEDLAAITGATVISAATGRSPGSIAAEDLGEVERASIEKDSTTLLGGAGERARIEERAARIRAELRDAASDYDREGLRSRLARLLGGVAVIKVGAPTEVELHLRRERLEDALAATRAAAEEGLIPGGGVGMLRAETAVRSLRAEGDERVGLEVVAEALGAPLRQIAVNAGHDGGSVLAEARDLGGRMGFNAVTERFEDMSRSGIDDPAKVARVAIKNAVSIAGLVLTTQTLVAEVPDPEEDEDEADES